MRESNTLTRMHCFTNPNPSDDAIEIVQPLIQHIYSKSTTYDNPLQSLYNTYKVLVGNGPFCTRVLLLGVLKNLGWK